MPYSLPYNEVDGAIADEKAKPKGFVPAKPF